jgi:hypothetical protein
VSQIYLFACNRFRKETDGGEVEYNRRQQLRGKTMERIAWVTDSTGTLDEELLLNEHVYVVPMIVIIDGKEYEDGIDLLPDELYRRMSEEKVIATTSQPSVGRFHELYKELKHVMIESLPCIFQVN